MERAAGNARAAEDISARAEDVREVPTMGLPTCSSDVIEARSCNFLGGGRGSESCIQTQQRKKHLET